MPTARLHSRSIARLAWASSRWPGRIRGDRSDLAGPQRAPRDVPYFIPRFCDYLRSIVDGLGIARFHVMGISYGGFVGLDYARLYQERLHTLTISGILLSHETLFDMYHALSLRLYTGGPVAFELYTHYRYEKIFGESFVRQLWPKLEKMRQGFEDRWKNRLHCLVRLTEAQVSAKEALGKASSDEEQFFWREEGALVLEPFFRRLGAGRARC